MSVHRRPEGISDVFTEPTEAPPAPARARRPRSGCRRLAALDLATAHQHARRAPAAHAARRRRGARARCWPQRAQDTAQGRRRTSPTTRRPARGSTGSGSSTSTRRSGSRAIYILLFVSLVGCILPRTKVHLARRARPPAARTPPVRPVPGAGRPGRRTPPPAQVADDAAAVLRGGWRWLPVRPDLPRRAPATRATARRRCPRSAATCARPATSSSTWPSSGCSSPWPPARCCTTAARRSSSQGRGFANAAGRLRHLRAGHRVHAVEPGPVHADARRVRVPVRPRRRSQSRDFTAHVTLTDPRRGAASRRPSRSTTRSTRAAPRSTCRATGTRPTSPCATPPGEVAFSGRDAVPAAGQGVHVARRGQGARRRPATRSRSASSATCCRPSTCARRRSGPPTPRVYPQPDDPAARARRLAGQPRPRHRRPAERVRARRGADDASSWTTTASRSTLVVRPGETVDLPDGLGTLTFNGLPRYVALDLRHDPALAVRARVRAARVRRARRPRCSRRDGASGCGSRRAPGDDGRPYSGRPPPGSRAATTSACSPSSTGCSRQTLARTADRPPVAPRGPTSGEAHTMNTGDLSTLARLGRRDRVHRRARRVHAWTSRASPTRAQKRVAARPRSPARGRGVPPPPSPAPRRQSAPGRSVARRGDRPVDHAARARAAASPASCCAASPPAAGRPPTCTSSRSSACSSRSLVLDDRAAPPRSSRSVGVVVMGISRAVRSSSRSTRSTSRPTRCSPPCRATGWSSTSASPSPRPASSRSRSPPRPPGAAQLPRGGLARTRRRHPGARSLPRAGSAAGSAGSSRCPTPATSRRCRSGSTRSRSCCGPSRSSAAPSGPSTPGAGTGAGTPRRSARFVAWVVYAAYLHARTTRGWSGRRASYFVFVGYAVVLVELHGREPRRHRQALVLGRSDRRQPLASGRRRGCRRHGRRRGVGRRRLRVVVEPADRKSGSSSGPRGAAVPRRGCRGRRRSGATSARRARRARPMSGTTRISATQKIGCTPRRSSRCCG